MATVSKFFKLNKTQAELDFVDVFLESDIPLFIDPFAIAQREDRWSQNCHRILVSYFQRVIDNIRDGKPQEARELLLHLREPNETRFGYSISKPQGAGIGHFQASQILKALEESTAVRTGFIKSLEECELMIEGISRDKISDLTTNIVRKQLAEYTKEQCELWGMEVQAVPLAPYYSIEQNCWVNQYYELPTVNRKPILLVPKVIARYDLSYDHQEYYRHFVLEFLQVENLNANSSLVRTLKSGRRIVYKKDIAATYPCTKENLFRFSRNHPEVLDKYADHLAKIEKGGDAAIIMPEDERVIAKALIEALSNIEPGGHTASEYHNLMIGIMEFLFYPNLICPMKEREIHEGRKRIDIVMENGASAGALWRLHYKKDLPCAFVPIECKNYQTDVANPELDQLAGRFSANRGKFGILCCRNFEDKGKFMARCRDTFRDDRGLIIPLDDSTVVQMLSMIEDYKRDDIDGVLNKLIASIWLS